MKIISRFLCLIYNFVMKLYIYFKNLIHKTYRNVSVNCWTTFVFLPAYVDNFSYKWLCVFNEKINIL